MSLNNVGDPARTAPDTTFDPTLKVIPQVRSLTTSLIRSFDQEISSIPNILKLTLGEPHIPTPEFNRRAPVEALGHNRTHYAQNAGTPGLRQAISVYLARRREFQFDG